MAFLGQRQLRHAKKASFSTMKKTGQWLASHADVLRLVTLSSCVTILRTSAWEASQWQDVSPSPEVAWKRGLRANVENMAASVKHLSYKCCAAALCNNRSDNRKDLIFHSFPKDRILRKTWEIKMKRDDKKFASNTALYCCSEHFVETDYRKSLTGARRDLIKNAVPSIFTWTDRNDEVS